ncbi:hypothetical protein HanLR1_Chr05g0186611 [Helianthus annuus]|nr:hypothetical protein HanLR1_Chr05g0186611 [Helianthus annuus]
MCLRFVYCAEFCRFTARCLLSMIKHQLAQTSKDVEQRVNTVLKPSQSVYNQTLKISDSQMELQNGQIKISERIDEGMTMLNESTNKLGEEMVSLRNKVVEIEKELEKWEMRCL